MSMHTEVMWWPKKWAVAGVLYDKDRRGGKKNKYWSAASRGHLQPRSTARKSLSLSQVFKRSILAVVLIELLLLKGSMLAVELMLFQGVHPGGGADRAVAVERYADRAVAVEGSSF